MRACVFCEIIAGRKAASVIHADDSVVAILDHKPATVGHVLVIPRVHMAGLADADDAVGTAIWRAARRVSAALRASGLRCDGVRLSLADGEAAGQDVFHLHLHVLPRYPGDGVVVAADWKKRSRDLLDQDAALIRAALAR
ncbi:HIT family protein [Microbispora bryophytorum]|uniref:HIT family protein n=1 Tax=Microbispora bryophytorum TaxID=1460882 RepID=UPI00115A98DD|nr:HIT family protein [Microbispora bryophytorum]MBD3134996.1 HIT family protein [Microbispora bryophytorum]TQS08763.1 HIT family protein [Microbispora bryophytorum]